MLQAEAGWLSYLNDLDEIIIDVPLAVSLFSTLLLACLHLNLVNLSCIVFPFALFHSFSPSYLKFPCQHLIFCPLPIISPSLLNQHFVTLHYITLQGTYASSCSLISLWTKSYPWNFYTTFGKKTTFHFPHDMPNSWVKCWKLSLNLMVREEQWTASHSEMCI